MNQTLPHRTVVVGSPKNMGVAIILTILFGPLGLLYASVLGGIVTFLLGLILGVLTLGFALVLIWPLTIVWAMIAVASHNKKLSSMAVSAPFAQQAAQASQTMYPREEPVRSPKEKPKSEQDQS